MALENPLLVVSDIHLSRNGSTELAQSLTRLVHAHTGHEIVLNGDAFTLSLDPPERSAADTVRAFLKENSELCSALRRHVIDGGRLTFVAGNHDAGLIDSRSKGVLQQSLNLTSDAPVVVSPWFVRRGGVHVEHGHVFDPDNAPTHPLAPSSPTSEPLGVALTRRFIAPSGATLFVHAHETTPLAGLATAVRTFGPRAPWIVARYFATAIALCAHAGAGGEVELEARTGGALLPGFAAAARLDAQSLERVLSARRIPTHHAFGSTFLRLYFDRVLATLAAAAGSAALATGSAAGGAVLGVAAAFLAVSTARGANRYGGRLERELARAAAVIREQTGAALVIFGHTHREESAPGYFNTGSFGYPRGAGRPYVVVLGDGTAEARRLD